MITRLSNRTRQASSQLKRLKRIVTDIERITKGITAAMGSRLFEDAAALSSDGLKIDPGNTQLAARMLGR